MGIYVWPWDNYEQVKVCVALKNSDLVSYDEKEEVSRIQQKLERFENLTVDETLYMKTLIENFGYNLNAS